VRPRRRDNPLGLSCLRFYQTGNHGFSIGAVGNPASGPCLRFSLANPLKPDILNRAISRNLRQFEWSLR
jgi:hypothetical protein